MLSIHKRTPYVQIAYGGEEGSRAEAYVAPQLFKAKTAGKDIQPPDASGLLKLGWQPAQQTTRHGTSSLTWTRISIHCVSQV